MWFGQQSGVNSEQTKTLHRSPFTAHSEEGQGLLELIIAIGVITTGLLSTLTLITSSRSAAGESAERFVATNLAREGVEVVRSVRDGNWLQGESWNEGLSGLGSDRTAVPLLNLATGEWGIDFSPRDLSDGGTALSRGVEETSPSRGVFAQFPGGVAPDGFEETGHRRLLELFPICRDSAGNEEIVEELLATCPAGKSEVGIDVRSTVEWTIRGKIKRVSAEEKLYDWR